MKKEGGFGLLSIILIMIITAAVTSIATGVIAFNNSAGISVDNLNLTNDKDLRDFIEVYGTLVSKYYDNEIDKKAMLNAAEEAMLNFLDDSYTTYLNDEQYKEIIDELSGTYNGIGIEILGNKITKVTKSSPAEKAGLQKDDIIIEVNGIAIDKTTDEEKSEQIKTIIKDENIKEVELVIERDNKKVVVKVEKTNLVNPSIVYEVLEGTSIGYIYIQNFSQNLGTQVNNALKELEAQDIKSLIIDVRDNVGGYLSAAEDVASLFLENGKIIYSLESTNSQFSYRDKTQEKRTYNIVVLINGSSASASEVLAAALRDSYGAKLVGTKSYGKGKVQQVVELDNGGSVKYTSAKWLTPKGECVDGQGLLPDYSADYVRLEKYDTQINKAIEVLS